MAGREKKEWVCKEWRSSGYVSMVGRRVNARMRRAAAVCDGRAEEEWSKESGGSGICEHGSRRSYLKCKRQWSSNM
jgi:hypothetical protein